MTKRILLPGLLLVSALAVLSCEREMEAPTGNTVTIKAVLDPETKTAYESEKTFTWLSGDRIAVLADAGGNSVLTGFQTETTAPSAEFTGTLPAGAQLAGEAYYPENLASIGGENEVVLTFPAEFTPDPANPLSCVPLLGRANPNGSLPWAVAALVVLTMGISWLVASTEPLRVNGKTYDNVFWLRTSDMLIGTSAVLMAVAVALVVIGYFRKKR